MHGNMNVNFENLTFAIDVSIVTVHFPLKMRPIDCPKMSVTNYQSTLRNIPEERVPHLHRGGSMTHSNSLWSLLSSDICASLCMK